MEQKRKFNPRILKIIKISLISFTLFVMLITVVSVKNVNSDGGKGFLGYKFFVVLSDSMKPEFEAGDLIFTKIVDPNTLKEGDIITFYTQQGIIVTHQIVDKITNDTGIYYITQGTNVDQVDNTPVPAKNVIGKYTYSIPKAGIVFNFIKSDTGFLILIFTPLMILVLLNGVQFVKVLKKYKKQKKETLIKQKEALEEERIKNERMNEEINHLKEKLNQLGNNG